MGTDWSRWSGLSGHLVEPDWRPLSQSDKIHLGEGGASIGWGGNAIASYLGGPTGVDRDGPSPAEVAQGWVFGILPTSWPDSQPQWLANDWGQFPYALGAPAGAVIQRFPIWYYWERGSVQTSVPPTANIPPPDQTPVLSSSDPTWGEVIPQSFGVRRVNGAPLWVGPVRRVAEHDFTGAVDFAVAFGTTARPSDDFHLVTLSKLFSEGKLIYDANAGSPVTQAGVTVTFYPGLPDALPDPTIQAAMGSATPAFRDMYYAVIRNHPLFHSDTKLPSIRAELVDKPAFQAPALTAMTVLSPPVSIDGEPVIADFDSGVFWAMSSKFSLPHKLHQFDMVSNTEISRLDMDGTLLTTNSSEDVRNSWNNLNADWWTIYDKYNGIIHFQHASALSNGERIGTMVLSSGKLISSYGIESNSGSTNEDNTGFSEYADFVRFRAFGTTIHGIMVATIFSEVALLTYRKQIGDASFGNDVKLSHTGILKGGDTFTFGFDVAVSTTHQPTGACSYPVLDRPELIATYNVDTQDFQNAVMLYGDGSLLMEFEGTLKGTSPAEGVQAEWFTAVPARALYDFAPYQVETVFVEPQTGSIIVVLGTSGVASHIVRLQPSWAGGAQGGCTMTGVSRLWQLPIDGVDPRLLQQQVKNENMLAGTFVYFGTGGITVRSLITGQELYKHLASFTLANNFVYDSNTQTMWMTNRDTPGFNKISLFGNTSTDAAVTDFLRWCALRLGYESADITADTSITETVQGGCITQPTTVRNAMTTVAAMYSTSSVEVGGKMKFVRPLPGDAATLAAVLTRDDLSHMREGDYQSVNTTTLAADELVSNVSVEYLDPLNDYSPTTQTFKRVSFPFATAKSQAATSYSAPIVVSGEDAMNIAGRLVFDGFAQGTTFEYRLPHRFLNIIPGDVVGFLASDNLTVDELSQVREVTYNGDWSMSLKGVRWSLSDSLVLAVDTPAGRQEPTAALPSDSLAIALDIPLIDPTDETPGAALIYTGAGSQGQSWWKSAEMHRVLDSTISDLYLATTTIPYGNISETLPACEAAGTTFATDRDTVLTIAGRTLSADMFVTVSDEHFRAGYNALAIGAPGRWEIVFFRDVTQVGSNQFQLSTLLRGRRGTNEFCDSHTGAEQAVLLKSNGGKPVFRGDRLDFRYRGKVLSYYAVGENTKRQATPATFTLAGNSAKPWSVCRMRATYASNVNAVGATSYLNECGQGNRQDIISVIGNYNYSDGVTADLGFAPQLPGQDFSAASIIDGSTSTADNSHTTTLASGQTAAEIEFNFTASCFKQVIDEMTVNTFAGGPGGTWDVEASNDRSAWVSLATARTLGVISYTNTTGYWYYRLRQTGGTTTNNGSIREVTFQCKADVVDANDILVTWLRRDRLAPAPDWLTDSQPMTESSESYQVKITPMETNTNSGFPKTLPLVNGPRILYSAADQTTDGFTVPIRTLGVQVAQLGQGQTVDGDVSNRLGFAGLIRALKVE